MPKVFAPLTLLLLLAGCSNEPATYPVKGTVMWQGQPLLDGHVVLNPDGPESIRPDAGKIEKGEFAFRATAGKKRVEIWANREKPGQVNKVMGLREKEQFIPRRYNTESILKIEVSPRDENKYEFVLTEK